VLSPKNTVQEVLEVLAKNDILSAPVRDSESSKFEGFIDIMDILGHLLQTITESKGADVQWSSYTTDVKELKSKGQDLKTTPISKILGTAVTNKFCPVYLGGTVYQLVEDIFSKGVHRAPVFDQAGIDGKLVGIVSQSDVARVLANNHSRWDKTGALTLQALKLGTKPVISMSHQALAIHGFFLMYYHKVSAVSITMDGKLLANLSASDLRGLTRSGISSLLEPIPVFLLHNPPVIRHPCTCKPKTRFDTAVTRLAYFGLHRLWVINDDEEPTGVVSLTDVMQVIASV